MRSIDVFISRKSSDAGYAEAIYNYLTAQGLSVFDSDHNLKETGNADYVKEIDAALTAATHMIVVGSSSENIKSSWVEAEWLFFLNRKRSGKTYGNLFTVITTDFKLEDVPPSLANYEIIPYNEKNFPVIYNYVRQRGTQAGPAPQRLFRAEIQSKYLRGIIVLMLVAILYFALYTKLQPYDATVLLKPDSAIKTNRNYPGFKGGELAVYIDDKLETKQVLASGEAVFKQLPASSLKKKSRGIARG